MRNYSIVSPAFWTGKTGKAIKAAGTDAQVLALYLMTSPHSNMIGLYFLPKMYIQYETGLSDQGALKALHSLSKVGFCDYDDAAEVVWVYEMARYQVGASVTATDNRVKSIRKEYDNVPSCKFLVAFCEKYREAFHLGKPRQAPLEGLLTEQTSSEQEQEQDQEQSSCAEPAAPAPFVTLTLNDKSEFPIFENQIAEWETLFPRVDVRQELREMRAWGLGNPTKRKTSRGVLKFVTSWLSREQDRGGPNGQTNHAPKLNAFDRAKDKLREWERQQGATESARIIDGQAVGAND
jgi:hypothetical protein